LSSIKNILKNFSKINVLVIGDVMIDRYWWGKVERISPEAPVPIVEVERTEDRPGGAANVALNLKVLGANVFLSSVIGDDADGNNLLALLKKNSIDTHSCLKSKKRITTVKTRILSQNHQLMRSDFEMTDDISQNEENELVTRISSLIKSKKIDLVIFEDYNKGVLTENLIQSVIALCNKKKILTSVDPKKKNFFAYKNVTLFKPNLRELQEGLNQEVHADLQSLKKADKKLREKLNHQITLITLSDKGIFISDGKTGEIVAAKKRNVADVSGAGDTVIAVASLCLAAKTDLLAIAQLSNLAGGIVCETAGVVPVNPDDLIRGSAN